MTRKIGIPVPVHFWNPRGNGEHLYITCRNFVPHGGDPGFYCELGYYNGSDECSACHALINRVWWKAPFICRKEPWDKGVEEALQKNLAAGIGLLFKGEPMKKKKEKKEEVGKGVLRLLWCGFGDDVKCPERLPNGKCKITDPNAVCIKAGKCCSGE